MVTADPVVVIFNPPFPVSISQFLFLPLRFSESDMLHVNRAMFYFIVAIHNLHHSTDEGGESRKSKCA